MTTPRVRHFLSCLFAGVALTLITTHAAHAGPQQEKMKACNAEAKAKDLKGDERKTFMSTCLSAKGAETPPADGKTAQQQKMTACNAEAKTKNLKGDERKTFMSTCLKG